MGIADTQSPTYKKGTTGQTARQQVDSEREEQKKLEVLFDKNERRIASLEKMVRQLSDELDSKIPPRSSKSSTSKHGKDSETKNFYGDSF